MIFTNVSLAILFGRNIEVSKQAEFRQTVFPLSLVKRYKNPELDAVSRACCGLHVISLSSDWLILPAVLYLLWLASFCFTIFSQLSRGIHAVCAKVCGIIKLVMPEIITRETLKNVFLWLSFPECGRLYPVLLSDQKEGALQTAVPKT